MGILRTNTPFNYLPPADSDMAYMAKEVGLKRYSKELVSDLCNIMAGGEIKPPSSYSGFVQEKVLEELGQPDSDGRWSLPNDKKTSDRFEAVESRVNQAMKYHQSVSDFLKTVDPNKIKGSSPLEKSMNLLKILSNKKGGIPSGGDGSSAPIFTEENGQKLANEINNILDSVESLDDVEKILLDHDKNDNNKSLQQREIAEDMIKGKDIWIKISGQLDELAKMKTSRSVKVIPDFDGNEVRNRNINNLGELSKINSSAWALKKQSLLFFHKAINKQFVVRERVRKESKKQLLYILIDCSGSMDNGQRISKAGGVLFNRLKAVISGDAEIYICFFDKILHEEFHATNAEEAKELLRKLEKENFSGDSTSISSCTRQAQKRIEQIIIEGKTTKPELVIVTDGDDSIDITIKDLVDTKMHAFVVENSNEKLTSLAIETGGVGINNL